MKKSIRVYNFIIVLLLILLMISKFCDYLINDKKTKIIREDIVKTVDFVFINFKTLSEANTVKFKEGQTEFLIEFLDNEFFITETSGKLMLFFYKKNLEDHRWYCLGSPTDFVPTYCKNPYGNEVPYSSELTIHALLWDLDVWHPVQGGTSPKGLKDGLQTYITKD